jgi:hypothetical protein
VLARAWKPCWNHSQLQPTTPGAADQADPVRGPRRQQLRLRQRHRGRVSVQRQGVHRHRQQPGRPRVRPGLCHLHQVPGDLLPPTVFRAPNTSSLDYNPATGTLCFLYQNHVDAAASGADVSLQLSRDGGFTWTDARTPEHRGRRWWPATTSSSPGWTPARPGTSMRSGLTADATRPTATSTPGRRRRPTTAAVGEPSGSAPAPGTPTWASSLGGVHRRLQRHRRVQPGHLPGLDRRP